MNLLFNLLLIKNSKFQVKDAGSNFGFKLNFIINEVKNIKYFGNFINYLKEIKHFKQANYYLTNHSTN